jgi:diguanylate cyclase (GGDEF)-like protein/PAS domain S-box-containing protein
MEGKMEENIHKLIENITTYTAEGMIITDVHGKIVWVNKGFEHISGYSFKEAYGKRPGSLLQGKDTDPETITYMSQCLKEGKEFSCEVLNYTKSGYEYWLKLTIHPKRNVEGEITHFMAVETDITELKKQQRKLEEEIARRKKLEEELKRLALEDPLTSVPNKRYFLDHFPREVERIKRGSGILGVIVCDIDHFKSINDEYGHAIGDVVLKRTASRLAQHLRKSEFIARYGGEEFVILIHCESEYQVETLAERLRTQVEQMVIPLEDEKSVKLTCSFGCAVFKEGDTVESLFERADAALYESKHNGRNRVTFIKN